MWLFLAFYSLVQFVITPSQVRFWSRCLRLEDDLMIVSQMLHKALFVL